jgi:hypothetical protein
MYEMLTGVPPLVGKTQLDTMLMHLNDKPVPFRQAAPERKIDPRIERVVMLLLEKNPDSRYQTMNELLEDLQEIYNGISRGKFSSARLPVADAMANRSASKRKQRMVRTILGVTGGIAVCATIGAVAWMHQDDIKQWSSKTAKSVKADLNGTALNPPHKTVPNDTLLPKVSSEEVTPGWLMNQMTSIDMTNQPDDINEKDLEVLRSDVAARRVKQLIFNKQQLSDEQLAPIQGLTNVKFASFDGDRKLVTLSALKRFDKLVFLSLNRTGINSEGMGVVGSFQNLFLLSLQSCDHIKDADLLLLKHLTKLRALELSDTGISGKAIQELHKYLPDCQITKNPEPSKFDHIEWAFTNRAFALFSANIGKKRPDWKLPEKELIEAIALMGEEPECQRNVQLLCYIRQARCEFLMNDPDTALATLDEGRVMAEHKIPNNPFLIELYNDMASYCESKKDLAHAIRWRTTLKKFWDKNYLDDETDFIPYKEMMEKSQNILQIEQQSKH